MPIILSLEQSWGHEKIWKSRPKKSQAESLEADKYVFLFREDRSYAVFSGNNAQVQWLPISRQTWAVSFRIKVTTSPVSLLKQCVGYNLALAGIYSPWNSAQFEVK